MSAPSPVDDGSNVQQQAPQAPPVRRGPGRPRKHPQTTVSRVLDQGAAAEQTGDAGGEIRPAKRGPGRPRKNSQTNVSRVLNQGAEADQTDDEHEEAPPAKRRPGRPRKQQAQAPAVRYGPGRPRNSERETSEDEDEDTLDLKRLKLATEALANHWPRMTEKATKDFPDPMTLDEFLAPGSPGCPQPIFDEFWTLEDENDMMVDWNASGWKPSIESIGGAQHHHLIVLWRACLRRFRIDPITLISADGDLDVGITTDKRLPIDENTTVQSLLWSNMFCRDLTLILCHPFWRGKQGARMLRLSLKYTVRCREDNQDGVYEDVWPTSCRILQSLFGGKHHTDLLLHERHLKLREEAESDDVAPSIESDLLIQLSNSMPDPLPPVSKNKLLLRTQDIARLKTALDELDNQGMPILLPTESAFQVLVMARGKGRYAANLDRAEIPRHPEELRVMWTNCRLNSRRQEVRNSRVGQSKLQAQENHGDGDFEVNSQIGSPKIGLESPMRSQSVDQGTDLEMEVLGGVEIPPSTRDPSSDVNVESGGLNTSTKPRLSSVELGTQLSDRPSGDSPNKPGVLLLSNSPSSSRAASPTKPVDDTEVKDFAYAERPRSPAPGKENKMSTWKVYDRSNALNKWAQMVFRPDYPKDG